MLWKKTCFKWAKMYLLRSPANALLISSFQANRFSLSILELDQHRKLNCQKVDLLWTTEGLNESPRFHTAMLKSSFSSQSNCSKHCSCFGCVRAMDTCRNTPPVLGFTSGQDSKQRRCHSMKKHTPRSQLRTLGRCPCKIPQKL